MKVLEFVKQQASLAAHNPALWLGAWINVAWDALGRLGRR